MTLQQAQQDLLLIVYSINMQIVSPTLSNLFEDFSGKNKTKKEK